MSDKKPKGFTEEEKMAMKARAKELAAEAKANKTRAQGESDIFAAIEEMNDSDKSMAKRIHEIVKESAPELFPKTWYGMPAYAKDDKVICFFQAASKFKSRYASFGFNDSANLDDGNMWETSFALVKLTEKEEKKIAELVKKAVS